MNTDGAGQVVIEQSGQVSSYQEFFDQIGFKNEYGNLTKWIVAVSCVLVVSIFLFAGLYYCFCCKVFQCVDTAPSAQTAAAKDGKEPQTGLAPQNSLLQRGAPSAFITFSVVWFALTALLSTCLVKKLLALIAELRLVYARKFIVSVLTIVMKNRAISFDTFIGDIARYSLYQSSKDVAPDKTGPPSVVLIDKLLESLSGMVEALKAKQQ